ncbi:hypothetical protein N8I77_008037 [Diaporthe amygdali]|uniref:EF-hand domain-containing protein n=1 Tax=Phomopsis amygdali TaxID=1214568 RepID=A0AAD9W420_PHOAM|nr:hypothetical protein N8I77_008037 [Diaporthe amygdali]
MALPAGHLKSSSLGGGFNSPRSSPFRRPESPGSPSPLRQSTPSASPTKAGQLNGSSRFAASTPTGTTESLTPRGQVPSQQSSPEMFGSPRAPRAQRPAPVTTASSTSITGHGNALSKLQPAQVRTLREGFQILDRDSDGAVNREDVADMLNQLGLPSSATDVSRFFPPSGPQTIMLATFLNNVASSLAPLSPSAELVSAFSAFDDDDSGQIDLAELRDALLHTAPEAGERPLTAAEVDQVLSGFSGKRAFGGKVKGGGAGGFGKRGEVFRYQDFVNSIASGGHGNAGAAEEEEAQE